MDNLTSHSLRHLCLTAVLGGAILAQGCASTGLSPREQRGQDISSYLYATTSDRPEAMRSSGPAPAVELPAKVAVAQIGEVAPPDVVLETLRSKTELFAGVAGISGIASWTGGSRSHRGAQGSAGAHSRQLMQVAEDLGADYLLLFGGTMDADDRGTILSVLDVTLVGAFVIPSRVLSAEARATAILIDVQTGRTVATATTAEENSSLSTTFSMKGSQRQQLRRLRDQTTSELAGKIVEAMRSLHRDEQGLTLPGSTVGAGAVRP